MEEIGFREEMVGQASQIDHRSERDDAFAALALLACTVASGIAAIYWIARTGFHNPLLPVLKALALSMFMTTAPFMVRFVFRLNERPYRWPTSYSFLWIASLLVTAVLGWVGTIVGLNPFYLLAVIGIGGFVLVARHFIRSRSTRESLLLLLGALIFAQWIAGVVWGRIYKNPLFHENLVATGVVHHDSLFLVALGNMLRTYGVASTGLDGLPYIPYHWGTPWLFAQWSSLLDSSLLDFYQLAYPVTIIPLFFGGAIALASEIAFSRREAHRSRLRQSWWFWGLFLAGTIGVIPIQAMDALGVYTSALVISESYAVAVSVGLLMVGATAAFWAGGASERLMSGKRFTASDNVFLLAVLPLAIAGLGFLKISLMILAFALAMYLAARVRLYRSPTGLGAIVLTVILAAITYPMVSLPAHNEGFAPLDFLKNYVPRMWWVFFPFLHFFWSWVYVIVRLYQERARTFADVRELLKSRRLLDVEAVVLVALAGAAPGFIVHIDGGSAFYFSDVQRWLALGLLLSLPPLGAYALDSAKKRKSDSESRHAGVIGLPRAAALIVALPLLVTMGLNAIHWTRRFAHENAATRTALYATSSAATTPRGIRGLPYLADRAILSEGLESSRNFRAVQGLRRLSRLSPADRRRTALFIPQSEHAYWNILTRPGACSFSSFVAPVLSGMAMIDGMPAFGCELSRFYGLGQYTPRQKAQTEQDASIETLCRKANRAGFGRVVSLRFDSAAAMTATAAECGVSPLVPAPLDLPP